MKVFIALFFLFLGAAMISVGYPDRPELIAVGIADLLTVVGVFWWERHLNLIVLDEFDDGEAVPLDEGLS